MKLFFAEPNCIRGTLDSEVRINISCDINVDRDTAEEIGRRGLTILNTFAALMEAARYCSLGQMSAALYGVGGQYRRNM